ncbi:MAG: adenylate/guanylate cyclase domain-containing protein [Actinomycetota bacterium]|nr:adenylate/guanylate cyclase domain-containing protein [Actinomycetota bacterium]
MTDVTVKPSDPGLAHWAELIERLRWAGALLDRDLRLVWASPELTRFLGSPPEEELGYGLHVLEALRRDAWRQVATPETQTRFWRDFGPAFVNDALARDLTFDDVPSPLRPLLDETDPKPFTKPLATSFDYLEPGGDSELPVMRVNLLAMPLGDAAATFAGALILGQWSVRPGLVSLLARGDEEMYERMAKLVEPRSYEGAVLFCDLQGSTELARALPTAEYFRLIRSLWTEIDDLVARHRGIVGKHAGDGASAYFLVDHLGSASKAASAAVRTARGIHERSEEILGGDPDHSCLMRVGIHWGSSLYLGQLVPGGRLDVTALGDAVNECARIEESARAHQTLASKALIEHLSDEDAASLEIDPGKLRYRPLSEVADPADKAVRLAGTIPVTILYGSDRDS